MKRALLTAAAVIALTLPGYAGQLYMHNNSVMQAGFDGPNFIVKYEAPRPGLEHLTIPGWPGNTLVFGRVDGNGWFTGSSLRLRTGCAPLEYSVSGRIQLGLNFELSGPAAQYHRYGCGLAGFSWSDPQSRLLFIHLGTMPQAPAVGRAF